MARRPTLVALVAAAVALAPASTEAQRPSLSGEKARVAAAVRADLERLAQLQRAHHARSKLYAADARDLRFTATSGAQVNIAYASMNSWAANASHPTLAPVACYVIVSATDAADAPSAQPFCTEARQGSAGGNAAATRPPAEPAAQTPPRTQPPARAQAQTPPPARTQAQPPARQPAAQPAPQRQQAPPQARQAAAVTGRTGELPGEARLMTRDVIANAGTAVDRTVNVSPAEFASALADFSREALAVLNTPAPVTVRDPYESTPEFEARRDAAIAAHERREDEFFRQNTRTFVVQMTVKGVTYDADREVVGFSVDPVALPVTGSGGSSALSLACYTRPVFWCTPEDGMTYDAGDLWRVPRATARQHDVLRTPMTLVSRYTVGRIEGERGLAISLVDMDLQARGQSVQRWPAASR